MSDHDPSSQLRREEPRHVPALPRVNAVAATIVAITSLGAAVIILILVPDDSGKAAAGAIATAGLALAGRLGTPSR
ncbi:hypothetical protein [Streptomyces sp. TLI_185]|uniref:hypothetical protein n=1 Tax=Streptomyces sp. TLI_185 TaxID=2485151 RepID=UPI000F4D4EE6|nr:hypothetical protein [Streptomyces sp. TLI_185]RPF30357.1 hypothetical protein EDD92_0112 [Streptomyces sp. TLI_185]